MAGGSGFDEIAWLRANSPAWRLLRAENAPLVLSFLQQVFVNDNVRSIPAAELASRLDDELFALNERTPGSFPKPARAYLDNWASPQSGWLHKYYPEGTDEPHLGVSRGQSRYGQWSLSKYKILEGYDFNLCFENSLIPYYCSEKIWHAIHCGCLPIYYGQEAIYEDFPQDSFLDYATLGSADALFEAVSRMSLGEFQHRYEQCQRVFSGRIRWATCPRIRRRAMLRCR